MSRLADALRCAEPLLTVTSERAALLKRQAHPDERVRQMNDEWMIDVLADLRQYAVRHYHLKLAEQLDDAIVVAAVELQAAQELAAAEATRPALALVER